MEALDHPGRDAGSRRAAAVVRERRGMKKRERWEKVPPGKTVCVMTASGARISCPKFWRNGKRIPRRAVQVVQLEAK